ncbi:MAG: hypothetical protein Q4F28_07830 [Eubacteriales bacterium]|nr:hypothetical protein [Eubacteriales bacterium]
MGKWRQKMAAALIVSMMMGTVSAGSVFAEENPGKRYWEQTADGWIFWRGQPDKDGNWCHVNRVVKMNEKRGTFTYCFNEDGIMNGDEIVTLSDRQYNTLLESQGLNPDTYIPEAEILDEDAISYVDGEISHEIYVYPDGPVAFDEWVVLDSEGHLASDPDEEGCGWYYFGEDGLMAKNREVKGETGKGTMTFRLGTDGKMISSAFAAEKTLDEESGLTTSKYYNHMGESIADKWQYIDEHWYSFDGEGYYNVGVASDSDAKFDEKGWLKDGQARKEPDIHAVKLSDEKTDKTVAVGKPVELKFTIELASPSNVEPDWKFVQSRHDIWNKVTFTDSGVANLGVKSYQAKRGPLEAGEDKLTKHVTIIYTPLIPCETEVRLMIDDWESAPYTVNATAGTAAAKGDVIKTMLSAKDGIAGEMDSALNPIVVKENISMMFNEDVQEDERAELKDVWMTRKSSVAELGAQYAMANLVQENTAEVSDGALELLGDVDVEKIQAAGVSLNAENGEMVGLAIAEPNEKPELNLGEAQAAERLDVDISVLVDGDEKSKLEIPAILTMPLPEEFDGKKVTVYHTADGGEPEEITSGTASGGAVSFAADEFSTYTFVVTGTAGEDKPGEDKPNEDKPGEDKPNEEKPGGNTGDSGSSSGSGSSDTSVSGQWIQDEVGWWYRYNDGTYPVSIWKQLSYNNVTDWYHFNAAGYMDSGWYTDEHSDVFYLNPVSNGFKGAMQTGWRFIDQKWFYFNPVSDGRKGAMIKDTTVDGYYIDKTGVCRDKQ